MHLFCCLTRGDLRHGETQRYKRSFSPYLLTLWRKKIIPASFRTVRQQTKTQTCAVWHRIRNSPCRVSRARKSWKAMPQHSSRQPVSSLILKLFQPTDRRLAAAERISSCCLLLRISSTQAGEEFGPGRGISNAEKGRGISSLKRSSLIGNRGMSRRGFCLLTSHEEEVELWTQFNWKACFKFCFKKALLKIPLETITAEDTEVP